MSSSNLVCVNATPTNVGLRVVRGPDWKWGNQDDGEGHVGTVVEIGQTGSHITPEKTVIVQWDSGNRSNYRVGYQNAYDLRVLDNAQIGIIHYGITCMYCDSRSSNTTTTTTTTTTLNNASTCMNGGTSYITGIRWKCIQCSDANLCSKCYHSDRHSLSHQFERYDAPALPAVPIPSRSSSNVKLNIKGIFVNSKVMRGYDWDWDNQDGGAGKIGKVIDIRGWTTDSFRSVANVVWPSGVSNVYRLGHRGKVDLKYVAQSDGGKYYRDHLPIFSISSDSLYLPTVPSYPVSSNHSVSKVDAYGNTTFTSHSHAASNNDNTSIINSNSNGFTSIHTGIHVNNNADIVTNNECIDEAVAPIASTTGASSSSSSSTAAATATSPPAEGDDLNGSTLPSSFPHRPDWPSGGASAITSAASQVTASSSNAFSPTGGDVVDGGATSAALSSTVVPSSGAAAAAAVATNAVVSPTSVSAMPSGAVSSIVTAESTCTSNKTSASATNLTPSSASSSSSSAAAAGAPVSLAFKVGDKVKVIKNRHELRVMQTGHGGWNPKMAKYCHQIGVVHRITVGGDVRVKFGLGDKFPKYTFHPASLAIVYFVGDAVKVIEDEQQVKLLQDKHGEWVDQMKAILGAKGKVIEIYMDGDLRVSFENDKTWTLNPATVTLVQSNMVTLETALAAAALAASTNNSPVATVTSTSNEIDDTTLVQGDTNMLNSLSPRFAQISLDEPHLVHQTTHGGPSGGGRIFHATSSNRHTLPDLSDVLTFDPSMTHSPSSTSVPLAIPGIKHHSRMSHAHSTDNGHLVMRKDKNNRSALLPTSNTTGSPGGSGVISGQSTDERVKYLESKLAEMEEVYCCGICLERVRNVVFLCGHGACVNCAQSLRTCHMCRQVITRKINIY